MLISILIPTYNYPSGVRRILDSTLPLPDDVEIIICDDSTDASVEDVCSLYASYKNFHYFKNSESSGAISNWNLLVSKSVADYIVVLHHDELPSIKHFAEYLKRLVTEKCHDVYNHDVVLVDPNLSKLRIHSLTLIRSIVIKYFPELILRRNYVGPTGALVLRRSLCPKFDDKLKWFVDNDFYFSLRSETSDWCHVSSPKILSIQDTHASITRSLSSDLKKIKISESSYLKDKHSHSQLLINPVLGFFVSILEFVLWYSIRLYFISVSILLEKRK